MSTFKVTPQKGAGLRERFTLSLLAHSHKSKILQFFNELGIDVFRYAVENNISLWERIEGKIDLEEAKRYYSALGVEIDEELILDTLKSIVPEVVVILATHQEYLSSELAKIKASLK